VFCREWCTSLPAGKGREGEGRADPPISGHRQWRWRVAPRAATVPALLLRV
jgi:hypothetical protein